MANIEYKLLQIPHFGINVIWALAFYSFGTVIAIQTLLNDGVNKAHWYAVAVLVAGPRRDCWDARAAPIEPSLQPCVEESEPFLGTDFD